MSSKKNAMIRSKRAKKKMALRKTVKRETKEDKIIRGLGSLIPKKLESRSTRLRTNEFQDSGIVLKNPFSLLAIGPSGSGKSTAVIWMLINLYKKFFDEIFLLSPTGMSDDIVKHLGLKKKNIFTKNLEGVATKLIMQRKRLCEKKRGPQNCGTCLVIFDDCSGLKKMTHSPAFIDAFTLLRHYGCSVIACSHKIKTVDRMARMNTKGVIIFPSSNAEKQTLIEEYAPPNLSKNQFSDLINYAWEKEDDFERPFLFINNDQPFRTRFRKGFHKILELK